MAFSLTLPNPQTFSCFSSFSKTTRNIDFRRRVIIRAEAKSSQKLTETKTQDISNDQPPPKKLSKPVYSMKKGQIVSVDKEKYLNSINYLSVGHPPYYKGLDYIYEDRGEVLDMRIFETGEHALISWVGIPTSPAWLPTDMLIKSDKLDYERM
ncbi:NAD(P)H-quinone oxidoreductase subunit O, chloroplastic [Amaranthus tricolor]|uniref:NAD(P)H-quinone oxidoreductase subunit O, chloroplastic n=1 Tax=Amaranthus tricolor TaxID=29722 RepID=UPI0025883EBB|nr:NAD(P)H-quinone oxidoreductase subunit O, chloroplastic [Amaranthus tricolor]